MLDDENLILPASSAEESPIKVTEVTPLSSDSRELLEEAEDDNSNADMVRFQEALSVSDAPPPKPTNGTFMTYKSLTLIAAIFVCIAVAAALLVYNFAACPPPNDSALNEVLTTHNSTLCANFITTQRPETTTDVVFRRMNVLLPSSFVPISYDVKLIPFFDGNFTFHGEVDIKIKCKQNSSEIFLHILELQVLDSSITVTDSDSGRELDVFAHFDDTSRQFYIVKVNEDILPGTNLSLHMNYTGVLSDFLQGFYKSSYRVYNETRYLAATQFQPTDARRAFPCFDEPKLKARFKIHIGRPKHMSSISNMPQLGYSEPIDHIPGYMWDHFQESVPMSTYLVAFVVSDFLQTKHGNFSVWARQEVLDSASYALEVGLQILRYFENYFQIKYPLPKMDMVALPDFGAGAMENWGLITYRETTMLYEYGVSGVGNKQRVATVVSHELAHQWFGNLVTPAWWSDLWLNEGFASYVEYIGLDAIEPSWQAMDQFVVNEVQNVFGLDALGSSHKISIEVANPDEINDIFDRISYAKGAAIIRMMNHFLTNEVFKAGLTKYLKSRAYSSATQNDLWETLTQEARETQLFDNKTSVKEIMDTWTLQTGFPVLTVDRDYEKNEVNFSQARFYLIDSSSEEKKKSESSSPEKWWIPITYTTQALSDFNTTRPSHWLSGNKNLSIEVPSLKRQQWIIVNIQQTGFYRVNYDSRNWQSISRFLRDPDQFEAIPQSNRAQLIDDALNLARGNILDYKTAMDLTRYLAHERDYIPWKAAIAALSFIENMMVRGGHYDLYKKYLLDLIDNVYKHVGFVESRKDSILKIYTRVEIYTMACMFGHVDCLRKAVSQFHTWKNSPNPNTNNPISTDMKNVVYCTAIRVGGQEEWDFAWQMYLKSETSSEKEILLTALGCSREIWLLARYLERSMSDEHGIRKQDLLRVFSAVSNNVVGQPLAFSYMRQYWGKLKTYLGPTFTNINMIFKYSTRRMNTGFDLEELKQFGQIRSVDMGRSLDQAIERTEANINWMNNNYQELVTWLQDYNNSPSTHRMNGGTS